MEKRTNTVVRVILTGPESTGKTMLANSLTEKFGTACIPEYAREYVEKLKRKYTYQDVINIASQQVDLMRMSEREKNFPVFVDTYLIITKVWFQKVFGHFPEWLDEEIVNTHNDLYLLCKPDIPWVADPVRENGGNMREVLFRNYEDELLHAGLHYACVDGFDNDRINNALKHVNNFLKHK